MPVGGYLAGVDEERAVERPPRFPSVLGGEEEAVGILEAELAEAAQRLCAAERRLKVERHLLPRARVGENGGGVQRNRSIAIRNRHVLLQVDGEAAEVERVEILIAVVGELHAVASAGVRMQRVVAPVERNRGIAAQEVRLLLIAWNRRGVEDLIGRRIPAVGADADVRREVRNAAADIEQPGGPPLKLRARFRASAQ